MDILSDVNISGNLNLGSSDGSIMKFVDNIHPSGYCGNIIFKFINKPNIVPELVISKEGGNNANMPGHIFLTEFTLMAKDLFFHTGETYRSAFGNFRILQNLQNKSVIHSDMITIPANYDTEFYYEGQGFNFRSSIPRVEFFENNVIEVEDGCGGRATEIIFKKVEIDYGFYLRQCDSYGRLMLRPTPSDVERKILLVYQCGPDYTL